MQSKWKTYLLILLGISFSTVSYANEREPLSQEQQQLQTKLAELARGKSVNIQSEHYVELPDVRSIPLQRSDIRPEDYLVTLGIAGAEFLQKKGNFVIYKTSSNSPVSEKEYPVVLNERTGQLAIVTGTISVLLKRLDDALAVGESNNLFIDQRLDHLGVIFYRSKTNENILMVLARLVEDPRIQQAEMVVVEYPKKPL